MEQGQINFPLKLEKRLLTTLSTCEESECCGLLVGRWLDETLVLVAAYHCQTTHIEDVKDAIKDAQAHFPAGLEIVGMYFCYPPSTGEDSIMMYIRQTCASLKDDIDESNLLMLIHHKSRGMKENAFWYHVDARETSTAENFIQDTDIEKSMWSDLMTFRLRTTLQIIVPYHKESAKVKHCIGVELGLQIDAINSSKTSYHVRRSRVMLHNAGDEEEEDEEKEGRSSCGVSPEDSSCEILQLIDSGDELHTRRKIKDYGQEIVNVSVLKCATPQNEKEKSAFFIYVDEVPTPYLTVKLPLDCLALVESSEPVGNLPSLFSKALTDQLTSMGKCLCRFYQDRRIPQPQPVHIRPLGLDHVITICYPSGFSEQQLAEYRHSLHVSLHVPADRPTLRASNKHVFPDEKAHLVYLQNTHVGLTQSVPGGVVSSVEGVYSYHHYMQDNINDNGWGCAYRSLQTIVSWFRHQGYTDKPVPTHQQIQQALVDVGDKESSFVGSRKWIGSTEVGFCLDHLLGVQSRFLVVNAGRDLADKGRELAQHFQNQGTPVMIGGGVLAHTILGVDFNEQTGQLKFLILDPHYTGAEDIKEIQSKGWCGWKGPDFWDQNAFYNLCMPQRPIMM